MNVFVLCLNLVMVIHFNCDMNDRNQKLSSDFLCDLWSLTPPSSRYRDATLQLDYLNLQAIPCIGAADSQTQCLNIQVVGSDLVRSRDLCNMAIKQQLSKNNSGATCVLFFSISLAKKLNKQDKTYLHWCSFVDTCVHSLSTIFWFRRTLLWLTVRLWTSASCYIVSL